MAVGPRIVAKVVAAADSPLLLAYEPRWYPQVYKLFGYSNLTQLEVAWIHHR